MRLASPSPCWLDFPERAERLRKGREQRPIAWQVEVLCALHRVYGVVWGVVWGRIAGLTFLSGRRLVRPHLHQNVSGAAVVDSQGTKRRRKQSVMLL